MAPLQFYFLKDVCSLIIGALGHTLFTFILLSEGNFAAEPKEGQGCPVTCHRALAHKKVRVAPWLT